MLAIREDAIQKKQKKASVREPLRMSLKTYILLASCFLPAWMEPVIRVKPKAV